jgi:hypothetical protein
VIPVKKLSACFSVCDSVRNKTVRVPRRLQCQLGMDVYQWVAYTEPISEFGQFAAGGAQ